MATGGGCWKGWLRTQQEGLNSNLSMQTSMVEPVDVLERLELDVVESAPRPLMNELGLLPAVEHVHYPDVSQP